MKKIIFLASFFTFFCFKGFSQSTAYAVSADKMNVLYLGVDNPITIGNSVESFDHTVVTATNATISGKGSSTIVRPKEMGEVKITVSPEGAKSSTFIYRVKSIPDPRLKIGEGRRRMATMDFIMQNQCRVELDNFDFDIDFQILSAKVYFSGNVFENICTSKISSNSLFEIKDLMKKCQPGSVVTFEDIKVQGPDGVRTIDGLSIALY